MKNGDLELGYVDKIQEGVQSLLDCVSNEVNHMNSSSPSIYMVPRVIRDLSARCFHPRVVSIGPLHREDENLKAFEKHKASFLRNLMLRINTPCNEILEKCMQKAHDSMKRIKAYYDWTKTYSEAEVAKMMVMDACFILEFMHLDSNSPYPGINLPLETIVTDLVLLENQIPFFLLDEIYKCTILKNHPNVSLIKFARPLLNYLNICNGNIKIENISVNTTHHILSLLHQCYQPQNNIMPTKSHPSSIPSVVDLHRAGVNFEPYEDSKWMMEMDVKKYKFPNLFGFWGKPTLKIPVLNVTDPTELILRNLIVYEQWNLMAYKQSNSNLMAYEQSGVPSNHIASYVWAMDTLVNTKEDVAKLVDSKVLINDMGSNEEVANIINNLGNELLLAGFYYDEQWTALHKYCNGYWPKHITWLRRTYFNSPWNIIALFAGIILFALTVAQTIFTIRSA